MSYIQGGLPVRFDLFKLLKLWRISVFTKYNPIRFVILLLAILALSACAPQVAAPSTANPVPVTTSPQSDPITLRLAIPDGDSVLYAPYVLEFIQQADTLSNGTITIEPTWQAGDSTDAGYEIGVIQLVKEGIFDLGVAASRSFDSESITSFEALQAPFLIDNDALAKAVATSDATSGMLDDLSSSGLAGLTLWPEDLRHPFSVDPVKPLLSPGDFAGLTIRSTDTGVGEMLIKTLGGNPIFEASDYQGAESGLRQGASLTGRPAATGNVTFFAKYQVLFANGAAFEELSDAQRTVLREAAAAAQKKALAERPSDVDAGAAWCADGGTVVLASDEQVAAFQMAAQPVFDKLQQNSFNAESIAEIRELKAKTQPSPGAQACASTSAASMQASTEDQTWSQGLLPNGVWQAEISVEDLVAVGGVMESSVRENAGVHTFTFRDGEFTWTLQGDSSASCEGTYALVGDINRLTLTGGCAGEIDDIQWRLDDEGLHLHLVAIENAPFEVIRASLEARPYQKIADK
jgi:C4-dicarboxylate-binding protein DctP